MHVPYAPSTQPLSLHPLVRPGLVALPCSALLLSWSQDHLRQATSSRLQKQSFPTIPGTELESSLCLGRMIASFLCKLSHFQISFCLSLISSLAIELCHQATPPTLQHRRCYVWAGSRDSSQPWPVLPWHLFTCSLPRFLLFLCGLSPGLRHGSHWASSHP